ncbi:hypothetical protein [Mycobacterium vicinigordonae]|uniref:Uncharacterized protein n=1 Tax=Mycobacterium vicinigordonae TaxID=1719132 RepID=A0A7D6E1K9_9MYCO|nr:hypothetical protein [Mycobacterium vicinigordonae]QLL07581.1 hypothetical protein H0P51_00675 [Mycobacterium vicinigordonae]
MFIVAFHSIARWQNHAQDPHRPVAGPFILSQYVSIIAFTKETVNDDISQLAGTGAHIAFDMRLDRGSGSIPVRRRADGRCRRTRSVLDWAGPGALNGKIAHVFG